MNLPRLRRRGRIAAFQAAYTMDMRGSWEQSLGKEVLTFLDPPLPEESYRYALRLIATLLKHREAVDSFIAVAHPTWRIERMPSEDRNLLRLGLSELWYHKDIPYKTTIVEWLEIAKEFGTEAFPPFLNALLDRAYKNGPPSSSPAQDSLAGS